MAGKIEAYDEWVGRELKTVEDMMEEAWVPVNGSEIFTETMGEGPALVLIHAGIADSRMWAPQMAAFTSRYRVYRFDLPGYGQTRPGPGHLLYHEVVRTLLDHWGVEQAAIMGCSFGGSVALDFALAYPDRVRALVMVSPATISGWAADATLLDFADQEEMALGNGDLALATELNLRMWVDGPQRTPHDVAPGVRELVREMQHNAFEIALPPGLHFGQPEPSALQRLASGETIQAPLLIVLGEKDHEIVQQLNQYLQLHAEHGSVCHFEDAAHMVSLEAPGEFTQEVLGWLRWVDEHGDREIYDPGDILF